MLKYIFIYLFAITAGNTQMPLESCFLTAFIEHFMRQPFFLSLPEAAVK